MKKRLEERKIDLCDLFWETCLKWRPILVCGVIMAVLLGGFSYYKSGQAVKQETTPLLLEDLEEADQERVAVYQLYKKMYMNQREYNQCSPIMQLNANEFYKGEVVFYIDTLEQLQQDTEPSDKAEAFVEFYGQILKKEQFVNKITKKLALDDEANKYATEYISVHNEYRPLTSEKEMEQKLLKVYAYAQDAEACADLVQLIVDEVIESKDAAVSVLGNHEIKVLDSAYGVTADEQLFEYQEQNVSDLYNSQKSIADIEAKLSDQALQFINEQKTNENEEVEEVEKTTVQASASVSLKYVVIGFLGGAFAAVCLFIVMYLFNTKLRAADDFEGIYEVKLLGRIKTKENKKRFLGFVDNFILFVRCLGKKQLDEKESLEMICTGVKIAAQKSQFTEIFVSSTIREADDKELIGAIAKELNKYGIEVVSGSSILCNAESLEKSAEIGAVVFVEYAGRSSYEEIAREIELCKEMNTAVLGSVLVE